MAAGAGGDGARGWTSRRRGERPRPRRRPTGSRLDRRAVAHSGWGAQACSLSVDVVQRQRHAAIFFFAKCPLPPPAIKLEDGPPAAVPTRRDRGCGLRRRGSIDWLLRTAVGGLKRALYPVTGG